MTEAEPHLAITEYDGHRLRWWCSCGYGTDSLQDLRRHLNGGNDDDRPMRER